MLESLGASLAPSQTAPQTTPDFSSASRLFGPGNCVELNLYHWFKPVFGATVICIPPSLLLSDCKVFLSVSVFMSVSLKTQLHPIILHSPERFLCSFSA